MPTYLIERRDRVVDKNELLTTVWTGRVVEENNLTQAISALRKAFRGGGRGLALKPIVVPERACSPCDGDDPAAYRAYLRGYYLLQRPSEANLHEALAAFPRTTGNGRAPRLR